VSVYVALSVRSDAGIVMLCCAAPASDQLANTKRWPFFTKLGAAEIVVL